MLLAYQLPLVVHVVTYSLVVHVVTYSLVVHVVTYSLVVNGVTYSFVTYPLVVHDGVSRLVITWYLLIPRQVVRVPHPAEAVRVSDVTVCEHQYHTFSDVTLRCKS